MPRDLKHILCIDDEEDILSVVAMALETVGGFQVTKCVGGETGINKILEVKPDMILLDVMMPVMDGVVTLANIRNHAELEHLPVVFMTARVQPEEIKEYLKLGAAGVIEKPFDPIAISGQIEKIWRSLDI